MKIVRMETFFYWWNVKRLNRFNWFAFLVKHFQSRFRCFVHVVLCNLMWICAVRILEVMKVQHGRTIPRIPHLKFVYLILNLNLVCSTHNIKANDTGQYHTTIR